MEYPTKIADEYSNKNKKLVISIRFLILRGCFIGNVIMIEIMSKWYLTHIFDDLLTGKQTGNTSSVASVRGNSQ